MFSLLVQVQKTQLFDFDLYSACNDGSLASEDGKFGMQECPPNVDKDTINMTGAYYWLPTRGAVWPSARRRAAAGAGAGAPGPRGQEVGRRRREVAAAGSACSTEGHGRCVQHRGGVGA
eukprot:CAMPEP_0173418004 /NCGR_PEP_ID=MMETSP1357-20121228/237_1 /TAXON_ID=77926 /ORGANISM="Hemiselmis rufescens, Strain PCC563" /LENGTH=118 /DNA_ID=CAMNT_0014380405 /DNA_START=17 /DNA_END=374 /DNA_ORIENTATION=-